MNIRTKYDNFPGKSYLPIVSSTCPKSFKLYSVYGIKKSSLQERSIFINWLKNSRILKSTNTFSPRIYVVLPEETSLPLSHTSNAVLNKIEGNAKEVKM